MWKEGEEFQYMISVVPRSQNSLSMGTLLPAGSYAFGVDDTHEVNGFSSGLVTFIQKLGVCLLHLILSQIQPW